MCYSDCYADDNAIPTTPSLSPLPALGDLSTIIEAETSGISKHIPNLDESQDSPYRHVKASSSFSHMRDMDPDDSPMAILGDSYIDMDNGHTSDSSVLDLDPSGLTAEVLDAIHAKDVSAPDGWLNGANDVVIDAPISPSPPLDNEDNNEGSLNFGSLDPDLAALLSPHRVDTIDRAMFGVQQTLLAPSSARSSPSASPRMFGQPLSRVSSRGTTQRPTTPQSPQRLNPFPADAQSSTPARRRSASMSKSPAQNRPASLSALPRLVRSVTASPFRQGNNLNGSQSPQTSPDVDDFGRRASADQARRYQPPSPLSASISQGHRPSQSRLITPARRTASYSTAGAGSSNRPNLRNLTTNGSGNWETNSSTPSSHASSSVSTTHGSRRRLHNHRPSMDEADPERTFVRHRERSSSLSQQGGEGSPESGSPYQPSSSRAPAAEWLGPRTAKAFAAAGLLDHERAAGRASASSTNLGRYGSVKGGPEQDPRMQYGAPSRVAFSEASGSTSSWGRSRSASRTLTMSDAGGALMESPTFSIPRTTLSVSSTAPTSISASSHMAQSPSNGALQSMMEKHSVETEALLSALSDSQRASKAMRDENMELRIRVQELESIIFQMRQQQRSASPQPPSRSLSRLVHERISQPSLDHGLPRRPPYHAPSSFLHPNLDPRAVPSREASPNPFKETPGHRRRFSTTSSNFHLPPSNMSLLTQEVDMGGRQRLSGGFSSPSGSPPSPTLVMPKRSSSLRHTHQHKRSMSSGDNTSPTTANFSLTGSPGSLYLRPEHEMHLGDMASLDLAFAGEDSGEDDAL